MPWHKKHEKSWARAYFEVGSAKFAWIKMTFHPLLRLILLFARSSFKRYDRKKAFSCKTRRPGKMINERKTDSWYAWQTFRPKWNVGLISVRPRRSVLGEVLTLFRLGKNRSEKQEEERLSRGEGYWALREWASLCLYVHVDDLGPFVSLALFGTLAFKRRPYLSSFRGGRKKILQKDPFHVHDRESTERYLITERQRKVVWFTHGIISIGRHLSQTYHYFILRCFVPRSYLQQDELSCGIMAWRKLPRLFSALTVAHLWQILTWYNVLLYKYV